MNHSYCVTWDEKDPNTNEWKTMHFIFDEEITARLNMASLNMLGFQQVKNVKLWVSH